MGNLFRLFRPFIRWSLTTLGEMSFITCFAELCYFPGGSDLVINLGRQERKAREGYNTSLYDIPLSGFPSVFAMKRFHTMTHR